MNLSGRIGLSLDSYPLAISIIDRAIRRQLLVKFMRSIALRRTLTVATDCCLFDTLKARLIEAITIETESRMKSNCTTSFKLLGIDELLSMLSKLRKLEVSTRLTDVPED